MAKTVDLNEKTLEKEKQDFIKMCRFFEMLANVLKIGMLVCVPVLVVVIVLSTTGIIEMGEHYNSAEGIVSTGALCISCVGFIIALNFGVKIFKNVRTAESPFCYDIADKIKGAGFALAVTGVVDFLMNVTVKFLVANGTLYFKTMTYLPDTIPFLFGAFLLALAYIFNYGCKLQQEADETL